MAKKKPEQHKPTFALQIACLVTLVVLRLIDGIFTDSQVHPMVYAMIAGILFGVGSVKNFFGGGK